MTRINTNMSALNAWRSMTHNSDMLQKSLEKLSSGYRINRAADDAAGLAVSEKMRAQIRGLNMAVRNTQDGVSLMQTAEGGASKIQDMLQRMRELAVQASSDGLQDEDRTKLQEEFTQLTDAIDSQASTVKFNGRVLLDGSCGSKSTINSGSSISATSVDAGGLTSSNLASGTMIKATVTAVGSTETLTGDDAQNGAGATTETGSAVTLAGATALSNAGCFNTDLDAGGTLSFTQDGTTITVNMLETNSSATAVKDMTGDEFTAFINDKAADAGMAMRTSISGGKLVVESNTVGSNGNVTVAESGFTNATFGFNASATTTQVGGTDAAVTLQYSTDSGSTWNAGGVNYTATADGNSITGTNYLAGLNMTVSTTGVSTATLEKATLDFQTGANSGETISASLANLTKTNLGIGSASLSTKAGATAAIDTLDTALGTLNTERAKMGAVQNRLENQIDSLQTQSENLTAAESRIRDVDMAAEMATFTKFQVLSQASTAMLAQANQSTQGVLSLLRG